jgi:CheY-like chemotaxis protein
MKPRLLVAEGDSAVAAEYRQYFTEHGLRVETARDGLHCVEMLDRYVPHALILNCELRWGGGDGVLAVMRQDERLAATPVLLLMGEGMAGRYDAAGERGWRYGRPVIGCFRKPARLSDLLETLITEIPELATNGFLAEAERLWTEGVGSSTDGGRAGYENLYCPSRLRSPCAANQRTAIAGPKDRRR